MTPESMIAELISCFVMPPQAMQDKMIRIARSIPEDSRQAVIDHITEAESSSTKISVKHMVEACRALGVSFHESKYMPTEPWQCDACGHEFKYHPAPSTLDKINNMIFDVCPMCGFQPVWTKTRDAYAKMGKNVITKQYAEQYMDQVQRCTENYGPGGKKPNGEIRGPYFSRSKAEEEQKDEDNVNVDAIIAKLATDRRWLPRAHA